MVSNQLLITLPLVSDHFYLFYNVVGGLQQIATINRQPLVGNLKLYNVTKALDGVVNEET